MRMPAKPALDNRFDLDALAQSDLFQRHPAQTDKRVAPRQHKPRDRMTIEIRGLGKDLHGLARTRGMTTATLVRTALRDLLSAAAIPDAIEDRADVAMRGPFVKLTLRLPAAQATLLARRARSADVSQGIYVASLLDDTPAKPLAPDHGQAVAALTHSTAMLAALSADLNELMRTLSRAEPIDTGHHKDRIQSLSDEVRSHLAVVAPLVAALRPAKRPR